MRITDPDFDAEMAGTTSGDRLVVEAYYDGDPVTDELDITAWSLTWAAGQQVQGQATLTIADPDGMLAPWTVSDALGPGGSRLHLAWVSGLTGTRVPLGIWRITDADPVETWRVYDRKGIVRWIPGGGSVTVRADEDATKTAQMEGLDAEVVIESTALAEVTRLMSEIAAVTVNSAVIDRPVTAARVYDTERLDEIEDLLEPMAAVYRCASDGSLEIVPEAGVDSGWTIAGGDDGVLIDVRRALSDAGLYNAVISTSETDDGLPLVGRAYITGGPLVWGGPFGRVPLRHNAVATTQSGVQADAETLLANREATSEVVLPVECLTHPGVQLYDIVTVMAATTAGEQPLRGRVVGMQMSSATSDAGTTPAKRMSLSVAVATDVLEVVANRVRHGR